MKLRYKKRPEIIEAIKYDGTNLDEINEFTKNDSSIASIEKRSDEYLYLQSTRGCVGIYIGDYVAEDMTGKIQVFSGKVFEALYESIYTKEILDYALEPFRTFFEPTTK